MGLAVLPARLKSEMSQIADAILNGDDISSIESIAKHAKWVSEWRGNYELNDREQIEDVLKTEIGKVFAKVLECSGSSGMKRAGKLSEGLPGLCTDPGDHVSCPFKQDLVIITVMVVTEID